MSRFRTHLCLGDAVLGQLDDGEVALADGPLDVVEADPDGRLGYPLALAHRRHLPRRTRH